MADRIAVLIVDDSALMRSLISKIVEATPGLSVADRAMNGVFALQKIRRSDPDVIVLDIEMPQMNGIEFLKERKRLGIEIPVIILSSLARKGAEITMEALSLGASDFVTKPSGSVSEDIHKVADQLSGLLIAYGGRYRRTRGRALPKIPPEPYEGRAPEREEPLRFEPKQEMQRQEFLKPPEKAKTPEKVQPLRQPGPIEIIAIGISTGGPNALREVFARLDPDLPQPIMVVQHMPPGFTEEFAKSLDRICPLEVKEAGEGDLIKPGRILIAPGDHHLEVERRPLAAVARITEAPQVNGHRPSADVLFASVAKHYGNRALGVIMTGMGKDGAKELGTIYREGGITLGQDEASSIVYGMPKAAWELGVVTQQVALSDMAETICRIAKEGAERVQPN